MTEPEKAMVDVECPDCRGTGLSQFTGHDRVEPVIRDGIQVGDRYLRKQLPCPFCDHGKRSLPRWRAR